MTLILQLFLVAYLIVCNTAVLIRLYRSFLRYASPVKGYALSVLVVVSLLSADYFMYDYTAPKIEDLVEGKAYGTDFVSNRP